MGFGAFFGQLLAPIFLALLKDPAIRAAIREAFSDTAEDGAKRDTLRDGLRARIDGVHPGNADGLHPERGTGAVETIAKGREGLGG